MHCKKFCLGNLDGHGHGHHVVHYVCFIVAIVPHRIAKQAPGLQLHAFWLEIHISALLSTHSCSITVATKTRGNPLLLFWDVVYSINKSKLVIEPCNDRLYVRYGFFYDKLDVLSNCRDKVCMHPSLLLDVQRFILVVLCMILWENTFLFSCILLQTNLVLARSKQQR